MAPTIYHRFSYCPALKLSVDRDGVWRYGVRALHNAYRHFRTRENTIIAWFKNEGEDFYGEYDLDGNLLATLTRFHYEAQLELISNQ